MAREFDITKEQRDLAHLLVFGDADTGASLTVVEACRRNDTARSTYYEWIHRNEDFTAYMDYLADQALKARIGKYDRILDRIADGENEKLAIDAINTLFKRIGKYKQEFNVNATIDDNKSVSEKSIDELKADLERMKRGE